MTTSSESNGTHEDTVLSAEELDALLAGTEGVTPGPWVLERHGSHSRYFGNIVGNEGRTEFGNQKIRTLTCQLRYGPPEQQEANGAHMARCDPDTIRKLVTEVKDLRSHSRASGVKALEWQGNGWPKIANVFGGRVQYQIWSDFEVFCNGHIIQSDGLSFESAQAIAQSHFNASIQSCLVAEGVEPLRAALERIKAIKYPPNDTHYALKATIDYARDQAREALSQAQGEAK